ncbi:HAD-IIB family hydrolase [Promicromonospora sp. NPDC023805]|uniref:HAD family hydrolase n=1 Tax=Promicromonospora sp. NPDC023805 TaxID=3154696 RepID=UPI0033C15136
MTRTTPTEPADRQTHLVGLDIDGTLLVTGQLPSPAVVASIKAARHAGHEPVLATGRSLSGALAAARVLEIGEGYVVASNGSVVAKMARAGCEVTGIHTVDAKAVVQLVSAVRPDLAIAAEIVGVGYHVTKPFPRQDLGGEQVEVTRIENLWAEPTPRLVIHGENAQYLVPSIRTGGMTATRTRPDWVDVTPGGVSKATALEAIRRELGIPKSRTIAIGDSENDISMLRWAERGIAMGNASALVRFSANYATKDIDDDGAALILHALARSDQGFTDSEPSAMSTATH